MDQRRSCPLQLSDNSLACRLLDGAQNVSNVASLRRDKKVYVFRHHHIRPDEESVPLSRDAKAVEEDVANPGLIEESLSSVAGEGEFVRESVSIERLAFGSELLLHELWISMWNTRVPLCGGQVPDKRHDHPPVRGTPGFLFVVARSRTNGTAIRLSGAPCRGRYYGPSRTYGTAIRLSGPT